LKRPPDCELQGCASDQPRCVAAVFYITPQSFALTAGENLTAKGQTWFSASSPVNIQVDIAQVATGTIEAKEQTVVALPAEGEVKLGDKPVELQTSDRRPNTVEFSVPAGKHTLSFAPKAAKLDIGSWQDAYARLEKQHNEKVAALAGGAAEAKQMQAAWKLENYAMQSRTVYVNAEGQEVADFNTGTAKCWTKAQAGANAREAVDGDRESYCAVGSGAAWSGDLPKDLGMEWESPVAVGCFQIDYYSPGYEPTMEGQQLQAWDGEKWYPVEAEIEIDETGVNWTYTFGPIKTARIRVFITEFASARTAVREMRISLEAVTPEQREVKMPLTTNGLDAVDVDGDGTVELLAAAGNQVKCLKGDGTVVWEAELEGLARCVDGYDLDNDGKAEVLAGCNDRKLYCFDYQGNLLWSVPTPANAAYPERVPQTGVVKVVNCADIDADGQGEIVIGSSNWFAYCYDHTGKLVWSAKNWAHQPTEIAFVEMDDGKLASFISTTYCAANVFGPDGKRIHSVSVGYHGAAMTTAAGDMDGNGMPELITGSRVGGVHCKELGSDKAWAKFMGAEVSQVALADVTGDGKLELVAGSKNFHLLVTDAEGDILWARNVGEAITDLITADIDGDGTPEIVVGTEGGMVRVVDATGNLLSTFRADGNVTEVVVADLNGDGKLQIAAGYDDGFIYGDIK